MLLLPEALAEPSGRDGLCDQVQLCDRRGAALVIGFLQGELWRAVFQGIYAFHPSCLIYLHEVVHIVLLILDVTPLIPDVGHLCLLSSRRQSVLLT